MDYSIHSGGTSKREQQAGHTNVSNKAAAMDTLGTISLWHALRMIPVVDGMDGPWLSFSIFFAHPIPSLCQPLSIVCVQPSSALEVK